MGKFFVLIFACLVVLSSVSAADDLVGKGREFFGIDNPDDDANILAFNLFGKGVEVPMPPLGSFFGYLVIGLVGGLILWAAHALIRYWDHLMNLLYKKSRSYNPLSWGKTAWIGMIAGSLWKVGLLALFYAVVMQIPLVNRLVQFYTLDYFIPGFFKKCLAFVFMVGFLPSVFEWISRLILRRKLYNFYEREAKLRAGQN